MLLNFSSFSNPSHILINNLPKCNKIDIIELVKPYGNIITCNGPIERYKFMAKDLPVKRYSFVVNIYVIYDSVEIIIIISRGGGIFLVI